MLGTVAAASEEEMTASVQSVTTSIGEIVGVQRELGQAASDTVDVAKSIERASRTVAETVEELSGLIGHIKTGEDSRALVVKQTPSFP